MKVLLLTDVQGHGKKDSIVEVNDGFARNFLIPKKQAVEATKQVINEYNNKLAKEAKKQQEEKDAAMQLYKLLSSKTVDVHVRCGEGKMYGSVTAQDVAEGLTADGLQVDKKKITIKEPIKAPGTYIVEVWVYPETVAKMKINVIGDK